MFPLDLNTSTGPGLIKIGIYRYRNIAAICANMKEKVFSFSFFQRVRSKSLQEFDLCSKHKAFLSDCVLRQNCPKYDAVPSKQVYLLFLLEN